MGLLVAEEAHGVGVKLEGGLKADLEADIVTVNLNGPRADTELLGAVLAGMPLGDELQNLKLPVCQSVDVGGIEAVLPVALVPIVSRV